jgi:tetratricopeptide (TPR) repeat protein
VCAPGWREALQVAYDKGIDRPTYRRIEAFNEDGSPLTEFNGFKVHRRFGIRWHYPIHEVLDWYSTEEEKSEYIEGFEIHHHQNKETSRAQYLPLLEMAVKEKPDARNLYYLGRELSYYKEYERSKEMLTKYLEISIFKQERSSACRILGIVDPKNAEEWFTRATEEWESRESFLALANYYYLRKEWDECHLVAKTALQFDKKPMEFLVEAWAWGHMAEDLVAVSAWQLGDYKTALHHGLKALALAPDNERLQSNVRFYESKVSNANIQSDDVRGTE